MSALAVHSLSSILAPPPYITTPSPKLTMFDIALTGGAPVHDLDERPGAFAAADSDAELFVEVMFWLPPNIPSGGISNVPGILMKQTEQTRGLALAGLAVKVTSGFFLIGLSAVETERERNVQLLKERSRLDIPVVYTNARRAIRRWKRRPRRARLRGEYGSWVLSRRRCNRVLVWKSLEVRCSKFPRNYFLDAALLVLIRSCEDFLLRCKQEVEK
jgi:hypothetical protein